MGILEEKFEQLIEDYGLDLILEQNDMTPAGVLALMWMSGCLDLDDYYYTELDVSDED